MVDILNIQSGTKIDEQLEDIDKKVELSYFRNVKMNLTYVKGLNGFIDDKEADILTKKMAKKLGTHLTKITKDLDGNPLSHPIYGFGGDHRENIMKTLIDEKIPKNKIK